MLLQSLWEITDPAKVLTFFCASCLKRYVWVALVSLVGSGSALLNYIPDKADVGGAWTTLQGDHREGCTHAEGVGDGKPRKINTRMDTIKVFL